VNVERNERGVMELLAHGGRIEQAPAFASAVSQLLRVTPLTDFATCARAAPPFVWTRETLAMARTPVARTLALRAVSLAPVDDADGALGRATRALFAAKDWKNATMALDFLGHRAMNVAQEPSSWTSADGTDDTTFARAAGAMVARRWLDDPASALPETERRRLAPIFDVAARASAARELAALLDATSAGSSSEDRRTSRTSPRA
jgi:hypothetical protein